MKSNILEIGQHNYLIYIYTSLLNRNKILTSLVVAFFSLVIPVIYCASTQRLIPNEHFQLAFLNDYVAIGFFGILFPIFVFFILNYIEKVPNYLHLLCDEQIINAKPKELNDQTIIVNTILNSKWTILFWVPSIIIQLLWIIPIKNQNTITWLFYSSHDNSGAWLQNIYYILIAVLLADILLYFIFYLLLITLYLWKLSKHDVKVNPLHPDNCGGLSKIGHIGLLNAIALIILGTGIALVFVTDNAQFHPPFSLPLHYLYLFIYVAGTLLVFFLPLYFFRKPMEHEKERSLTYLRKLFEIKYSQLPPLTDEIERQNALKTVSELESIKGLYDLAKNMNISAKMSQSYGK